VGEVKSVRTDVPRVEEGEDGANGKDLVKLTKNRHVGGLLLASFSQTTGC
jgi:hypothetical protein